MRRVPLVLLSMCVLAGCAGQASKSGSATDGARLDVALLETTDLHTHVLSYNYDRGVADPNLGFERVATLIHIARKEFPNSLLFDGGDTIQGTALADFQAFGAPLGCETELAMYKAMDLVGYDAGTIGNHEFNYGLPFLSQVTGTPFAAEGVAQKTCRGPNFPLVLSNVFGVRDGQPLYRPYLVINKTFEAYTPDGSRATVPLKIGVLGFAPTPILKWDKRNLDGKVTVAGAVEAAQRWLPALRAAGADIVVAVAHMGLNSSDEYSDELENAGWHLAGVDGIDALLLGHSHSVFPAPNDPNSRFAAMPEVDNARGSVRGVPAVMGGFYGRNLGVIKLALVRRDGRWQVDHSLSHSEVRSIDATTAADPAIAVAVKAEHAATLAWLDKPLGRTDVRLSTVFADIGDTSALGVVNAAQREHVQRWIRQNRPDLVNVPVLSAAAAFKTGFAGSDDYTDIAPGPLSLRSATDLYLYPNTLAAIAIDGATLKAWLERSAGRFNRIDPATAEPQALVNRKFPGYNFDVIDGGVAYTIDITKPLGERIVVLNFNGKPVAPAQRFVVATNNYRATDTAIAGLDKAELVLDGGEPNRNVVAAYLREHGTLKRGDLAPRSWKFATTPITTPVTFTAPAAKADAAKTAGLDVVVLRDNGDGTATYAIRLGR